MPDPQAINAPPGELNARVVDKEGPFSFEGRFTRFGNLARPWQGQGGPDVGF